MKQNPTKEQTRRLESARAWMRRRGAYMAAAVARLGAVRFSDETETACIRVLDRNVELLFNADFFGRLKTPEAGAVLIHEALHFVFKHVPRIQRIRSEWERRLFTYAAEAVINDIIAESFTDCVLPGTPITGDRLLGQSVAAFSADEVARLLRTAIEQSPELELKLVGLHETDDHDGWIVLDGQDEWTGGSDEVRSHIVGRYAGKDAYGSSAAGETRLFERTRSQRSLREFLLDQMTPSWRFNACWSQPHRKTMSVYPKVILPVYEPEPGHRRILMAIDTSGSISREFLGCAVSLAETPIPGNSIDLVTFDTQVYPYSRGDASAKGGGGTSFQAVENYIQTQERYPDQVFLFTDGLALRPTIARPDRWCWILAPGGTDHAAPKEARIERFAMSEVN